MEQRKHAMPVRLVSVLTVLAILLTLLLLLPDKSAALVAKAISTDYPVQLMHITTYDNSKNLSINGTADNSALTVASADGSLNEAWRFDYIGTDSKGSYFKIINQGSGRLLTPLSYKTTSGTKAVIYGSESAKSQHWYVTAVSKDHLGNGLYYKIVNYVDTNMALTNTNGTLTIADYSGANGQKWLLNALGLQGFAGYCKDDNTGNIKAGDIGGLFGQTVEVSTFADLKKYAEASDPYTIVVTGKIDGGSNYKVDGQSHYYNPDGRIYVTDNKTIIGSYNSHVTYNVALCTKQGSGQGNNVIIRNLEMQHDANANGNDNITVYFGAGQNLWVDHVTFVGHADYNKASSGQPDYDKFLACCYDADYCTVSDCSFGLHEYGVILGYPDDTADVKSKYDGYPRMTLAANKFYQTLTRGPGLMRWGYYHSFNNYVDTFSMAYTVHSGCDIYAENCYYANGGNVICDWNQITYPGAFYETGSKFSSCNRTVRGEGTTNNPSYSVESTWRPKNNYTYTTLSADQAKTYCSTYSGAQSSGSKYTYITLKTPGFPSAGYVELPGGGTAAYEPASFTEGAAYRIKNANSGLYMEVAGGTAANSTNIDQWGSDGSEIHNIWRLYSAGDGYYYIASAVGDGGTFVLDVAGKKADNGTNIDLYKYNGGNNQQFMLTDNGDGTYKIRTRVSGEASAVEIKDASTASGANVQEWEINGANCQDWILESVADPGCTMNTSVLYTFENVNSGMLMEIVNADMSDNANVQQWGANGHNCQKWQLQAFAGGGGYYYLRSVNDTSFTLHANGSANGGNIDILTYSTKDSSMLFKFRKNLDGTYSIMTRASKDACLVEVGAASKTSGANVQQWEPTNNDCQKWNAATETTTVATTTTTTTTTATTTKATTTTTKATTTTTAAPATTAAATTTTATTTTDTTITPVKGDIVEDGVLSVVDLVTLQKYLLNTQSFTAAQFTAADMNGDGVVDVFDIALLKRALKAA